MLGGVGDGIELVVTHDDLGASAVDHALHDLEDPELFVAAINQVADEDGSASGMPVGTGPVVDGVAERLEQNGELGGAAMDVADDVEVAHRQSVRIAGDM